MSTFAALGVPSGRALCQYSQITGGEITIGAARVPVDKTITLQSGAIPIAPENEIEFVLLPAADGDSVSSTELNVPGGLPTLLSCRELEGRALFERLGRRTCKWIFRNGITEVTATIELVANAQDPALFNELATVQRKGAANTLPVRVHLRNPLLGNSCYIGSEASPILLHLTTGATSPLPPNTSISGVTGKAETLEEDGPEGYGWPALRLTGTSLVDNTFSVPAAEGCGGPRASIVDQLLDSQLKLPSTDGSNTVILDGTFTTATAEAVIASESFPPSPTPESPPREHHRRHPWHTQ